ncbi:MAG: 6-pyruvoyl-tetrahydropterin synthase-related protein [Eubacteriales bacterium]|nr:6-pyruvoyl-tetrahydropterin synthase-related protein [Eubacteriales bacterium]
MSFKGFKLKHKLIVLHSTQDQDDPASVYARTFDITLFISSSRVGVIRFDEMEAAITKTLERYAEKRLDQIPPFDRLEPTLETIGNVFYQIIKQAMIRLETTLEMLEISESPIRTFIVNEANSNDWLFIGDKKIKISSLIVGNMISQSISHLVSGFETHDIEALPKKQVADPITEPAVEPEAAQPTTELKIQPLHPLAVQKVSAFRFALSVLCLVALGTLVALYLKHTGAYPSGADIYGHLFKSDLAYNSIRSGDFYPLYTDLWYNGLQPYRYWAPLPYYLLAMLQFVGGGDVLTAYLLFIVFSIVAGGIGWLLWGMTYRRMALCTFLACVWFFLPDNMRVFFVEGNLPRMVIAMLLPYLFYFIWRFVEHRRKSAIVSVILMMCLITLCHAMIAAMTGITTFIFLMIYSISQRRMKESVQLISAMLLSFALCGIWLYPALKGGLIGMEASATAEVMKALSTPVKLSLNPVLRYAGLHEMFYFGLSILALSIIGLFLADKKSRIGFYTVILIFCGTTTAFIPFLEKLPLNQLFWMTRFTPIVYVIFILSLLEWKKCRRYAMILIAILIVLDCIPSVDLQRYHSQTPSILTYTLDEAKERTKQRVSLLDVSAYGSYPSFGFAAEEPKTRYTFGWAWQGAATADNIVMVNTALEKGCYYYLFDRSIELGDDTVLVRKELVKTANKTVSSLIEAASASGYSFYKETNYAYIFHRNTPETFGVSTEYNGLAIGRNARSIALEYPSFEEGSKKMLTDYTAHELSRYEVLYLSGFQFSTREKAEDLLIRVADLGVKVIIDMNQIPVDPITNRMTFFDVTAQSISFSNRYPELIYEGKMYDSVPFKEEYSTWNTVYLENVKYILGFSWFQNKKLPFIGRGENENILFMGYNFLYHAMETNDQSVLSLITDLMRVRPNQLPEREIVPLSVFYQGDKIIVDSPGGKVNTTLAYQDIFRSKQKMINENNLLTVLEPHTEIEMGYPYFNQGLAVSAAGLLGIAVLMYLIYREKRHTK